MRILEQSILEKACAGDLSSFEQVFRHYQPILYAFSMRLFHDEEKAKDLTQECFIVFWTQRGTIKNPSQTGPYLFSTMRNLCRREIRRTYITSMFINTDEFRIQEAEIKHFLSDCSPLDSIYYSELEKDYLEAVSLLPARCRQIFLMKKEEGLSTKEIADKLGLSSRTVENEVYRGLQCIRLKLKWYLPLIITLLII